MDRPMNFTPNGPHEAAPSDPDRTPARPTESERLTADRAEIRRALDVLCASGDLHELRALHVPAGNATDPKREITRFGFFTDLDAFADAAAAEEAPGVYLTLNPCNPALGARADHVVRTAGKCTQDPDITRRRWLLIDADPQRPRNFSATDGEKAAAAGVAQGVRAWLTGCGFPAPVLADSGNGFHLLYQVDLENTTEIRDLVKRFLVNLAGRFSTAAVTLDTSVSNASRICKLYGTVARKGPDTPDRPHRLSRILVIPDPLTVVSRELLESVAGQSPPPTAPAPAPVRRAAPRLNLGVAHPAGDWLTLDVVRWAMAHSAYGKSLGNGKHAILCPWNHEHSDARGAEDSDTVIYEPSGDQRPGFKCQHAHCAHRTIADLREKWPDSDAYCSTLWKPEALTPRASGADQAAAPEAGERPGIVVSGVQHREPVAEALASLIAANEPPVVFTQAGQLTEIHTSHDGPQLRTMGEPELRLRLSDVADFFGGRDRPVSPPRDLLQSLLVRAPQFMPELIGVSSIPIVRPDGSIGTAPGYDPPTRRYHAPHPDLVGLTLPEHPTCGDAAAAAGLLLDLVSDFPFETPADQAGYLALLLTLAARPALGLSPMALITAPVPGSGKGLLAKIASEICTAAPAKMCTVPTVQEEWHKRITSLLVEAPQAVVFDNANTPLISPDLALLLTSLLWTDRMLGGNRNVSLPNATVWVATGNNVTMSREIADRCYRIRLRPDVARPRMRNPMEFRLPRIEAHVQAQRAQLLGAVLTIVRAWFQADRPGATGSPTMGSFETWSETIAGMLEWAGVPDFLGNLEAHQEEADEETPELEAFLAALTEVFQENTFSPGEILFHSKANQAFREGLPADLLALAERDNAFLAKIGKVLTGFADMRAPSGRTIARAGINPKTKRGLWKVLQPPPSAGFRQVSAGSSPTMHFQTCQQQFGTHQDSAHAKLDRGQNLPKPAMTCRDTTLRFTTHSAWRVSQRWPGTPPLDGESGRLLAVNDLRDYGYAQIETENDAVFILVRDEHRIPEHLLELARIPEAAAAEWLLGSAPALES